MRLIVLGSSSKGNCYILDNGTEALMIECGVSFRKVQKAVDFDVQRIAGVLISHEHKDHAKEVARCLNAQIPVYCSAGTADALGITGNYLVHTLRELQTASVGRQFKIQPFGVQHDAAEPFGFLINHYETGLVLFATDTYYLRFTVANLSNILLECNYKQSILDENVAAGLIPGTLRNRTMRSHMEFDMCRETLLANDLSRVNNIGLIHLSDGNSNAAEMRDIISYQTGKNVFVAEPGMVMEFNKTPF